MAEDEHTTQNAAPALPERDVAPVAAAVVPAKPSLRRRAVSPDQTSLSTPGTPLVPKVDLPNAGGPAKSPALPVEAKADPLVESAIPAVKRAAGPAAASAKPGPARAVPANKAVPTKPIANKPVPVKPAPVKAVTTAKLPSAKAVASKPAGLHSAVPAAKPAPAYPCSKVAPDQGPVSAPAPRVTEPVQTTQPVQNNVRASQPEFRFKDTIMDMSANFSTFQSAMTDAQAKAQAAFEKSSNMLGEVSEFAKGNVEAMVASGKILAEGMQDIGGSIVAEGRTAFETMTGDVKELAAAKSPTDFLKIQSDMVRKNFDAAVAYSSKNSETFLKLMNDAFAPISGRVSLAVEKARQAAPVNAPVNAPAI